MQQMKKYFHWGDQFEISFENSEKKSKDASIVNIRVFHKNTFFKKKFVHTLTCPSGVYINQIQKLFLFGQV